MYVTIFYFFWKKETKTIDVTTVLPFHFFVKIVLEFDNRVIADGHVLLLNNNDIISLNVVGGYRQFIGPDIEKRFRVIPIGFRLK